MYYPHKLLLNIWGYKAFFPNFMPDYRLIDPYGSTNFGATLIALAIALKQATVPTVIGEFPDVVVTSRRVST